MVGRHCGRNVKLLFSVGDEQYLNEIIVPDLETQRVKHSEKCVQKLRKDELERTIKRTMLGMTRSILRAKYFPKMFLGEAVKSAAFIRKILNSKSLIDLKRPYKIWNLAKLNLNRLNDFSSKIWAKLQHIHIKSWMIVRDTSFLTDMLLALSSLNLMTM